MGATDYIFVQSLQLCAKTDFTEMKKSMHGESKAIPLNPEWANRKRDPAEYSFNRPNNTQHFNIFRGPYLFWGTCRLDEEIDWAYKEISKKPSRLQSIPARISRAATGGVSGEMTFRSISGDCGGPRTRTEAGHRQLWMYAIRHFPELVSAKENGQSEGSSTSKPCSNSQSWQIELVFIPARYRPSDQGIPAKNGNPAPDRRSFIIPVNSW